LRRSLAAVGLASLLLAGSALATVSGTAGTRFGEVIPTTTAPVDT
jgi:hypothetical protein